MGADLILVNVPVPKWDDGEIVTPKQWATIVPQIIKRLDDVYESVWDECIPFVDIEARDPGDPEGIIGTALAYVEQAFVEIHNPGRNTMVIECRCGDLTVLNGGTTWGDDPSDEFQAFNVVAMTGVFDEPFRVLDIDSPDGV